MKKLSLFMMLLCINVYAFAKKAHPSAEVLSLLTMNPYQVEQADASTLFGKPQKIEQGKEQTEWTYQTGKSSIKLIWNNRIARLQKYIFTSTTKEKLDWDNEKSCQIKTGISSLADMIALLGDPKDMDVEPNQQRLHYVYNNHIVNLFFYKGKLLQYEQYGLEKKRS